MEWVINGTEMAVHELWGQMRHNVLLWLGDLTWWKRPSTQNSFYHEKQPPSASVGSTVPSWNSPFFFYGEIFCGGCLANCRIKVMV